MSYTEEEIKKYLNILHNYKVEREGVIGGNVGSPICKGCLQPENFSTYLGQYLCNECGQLKGYILSEFDVKDFDRLHYQKKSIYHRKYYFDKKIKNISKLIDLPDEEKSELYDQLLNLNSYNMKIINDQYSRKRMINIKYIIKKILEEMGSEKYKNIEIKSSPQILDNYDNWWKSYKELIK